MLRYRRLDLFLELALLATIGLCFAGVLVVLVMDPLGLVITIAVGLIAGLLLSRLIGESAFGGLVLGAVMSILGLGLYALYLLLDLPIEWAAGLAGFILLLFGTVLARALIATGEDPRKR